MTGGSGVFCKSPFGFFIFIFNFQKKFYQLNGGFLPGWPDPRIPVAIDSAGPD